MKPLLLAGLLVWASTPAGEPAASFTPRERLLLATLSPPQRPARDSTNRVDGVPAAIALGSALFFDARLSGGDRFSCASCHEPARGWSDGKRVAIGAGTGIRNTPSLWNVAAQRWFFWDGRADSLWSQALKPIERDVEMGGSRLQVAHLLAGDQALRGLYEPLFGALPDLSDARRFPPSGGPRARDEEGQLRWWSMDGDDRDAVNRLFANVGKALAAFEATLTTGLSPFDRFVAEVSAGVAQPRAVPVSAQRGARLFIGRGNCVLCHAGPLLTNFEFHDTRLPRRAGEPPDDGRQLAMTSLAEDEFVAPGPFSDDPAGRRAQQLFFLDAETGSRGHFRTPSLRNVALTAPYGHRGQFATLREVVQHYNRLDDAAEPADPNHVESLIRPLGLTEDEVDDLLAFLDSLTSDDAR
jgi:cytochrome c peroxidase